MSIRAFVTCCSLFLMAWLVAAFVYTPVVPSGIDRLSDEPEPTAPQEVEAENLTVSVSP